MHIYSTGKTAQNFWAEQLLAHWSHETFLFEDNPVYLAMGFSCACSSKRQNWSTGIKDLKGIPVEVMFLINALKNREKMPGTPWHAQWLAKQQQLIIEADQTEFLLQEMANIEHKLNKHISTSKRARLKRRRNRLAKLLQNGKSSGPAKVLIQEGPLQGKWINAVINPPQLTVVNTDNVGKIKFNEEGALVNEPK